MKRLLYLFLFPTILFAAMYPDKGDMGQKKILHLTFHQGYADEFSKVCKACGYNVKTWHIPSLGPGFFDGTSSGNVLYNITEERADRIWKIHKETFEGYDLVCVSDTTPLARIFLQNDFSKPLLIWVCGHFDYSDFATANGQFPDFAYYSLISNAIFRPNVTVIANSQFAQYYADKGEMNIGNLIIPPCAPNTFVRFARNKEIFYIAPEHNETVFMDLAGHLRNLGMSVRCGRYQGLSDLAGYKGIIHLPSNYTNPTLFENLALGMIYFIPTYSFFLELASMPNYSHQALDALLDEELFEISEWYNPAHEDLFVYFDSWEDLVQKAKTLDFKEKKAKILKYFSEYQKNVIDAWKGVFQSIFDEDHAS